MRRSAAKWSPHDTLHQLPPFDILIKRRQILTDTSSLHTTLFFRVYLSYKALKLEDELRWLDAVGVRRRKSFSA